MLQKLKKRKKKLKKLLLINYDQLEVEDLLATVKEMRDRLRRLFRFHIGVGDAVSPAEIFEKVFEISPETLNPYERSYWWRVLQKIMSQLRHENTLFIIHKGPMYFVLQTKQEANYYKDILKRNIKNMKKGMKRADEWVEQEKWRNFTR